jgi:hypothetical protein
MGLVELVSKQGQRISTAQIANAVIWSQATNRLQYFHTSRSNWHSLLRSILADNCFATDSQPHTCKCAYLGPLRAQNNGTASCQHNCSFLQTSKLNARFVFHREAVRLCHSTEGEFVKGISPFEPTTGVDTVSCSLWFSQQEAILVIRT